LAAVATKLSIAWEKGQTRRPLGPGKGGLWIGDANRYPVVSAGDRRRIVYGEGTTHKPGRVDNEWRKRAKAAGVVIIDAHSGTTRPLALGGLEVARWDNHLVAAPVPLSDVRPENASDTNSH